MLAPLCLKISFVLWVGAWHYASGSSQLGKEQMLSPRPDFYLKSPYIRLSVDPIAWTSSVFPGCELLIEKVQSIVIDDAWHKWMLTFFQTFSGTSVLGSCSCYEFHFHRVACSRHHSCILCILRYLISCHFLTFCYFFLPLTYEDHKLLIFAILT